MAIGSAFFLAITISGTALGASWSAPVSYWSWHAGDSWAVPEGLVALDNSTLVAAFTDMTGPETYLRRSLDNGATWGEPTQLSIKHSNAFRMAGYGTSVDIAMLVCENAGCAIRYTMSSDRGLSYSDPVYLSDLDASREPAIARGADGTVVVVWYSSARGKIFARVSHDGGGTFDPRIRVARTTSATLDYAVAIGDGTIYVVSGTPAGGVQVRRSHDGSTWTAPRRIGRYDGWGLSAPLMSEVQHLQIAAEGDQAFVGWYRMESPGAAQPVYRRTTDGGASWSARRRLARLVHDSSSPMFSLHDGIARTTFALRQCQGSSCTLITYFRESLDGVNWTPRAVVSEAPHDSAYPIGLGYTDRPVIAYSHYANYVTKFEVRTRDE